MCRYARGTSSEYNDWATLTGDPNWSAEQIMRYMRKSETTEPVSEAITDRWKIGSLPEYHGTNGPIHTSFQDGYLPIEYDVFKAADEVCNIETPEDPWSGEHFGFSFQMGMISRAGSNKGKRSYSARAYFEPVSGRANLHVICDTMVSRVLLEGIDNTATDVELIHDRQKYTIKANCEVIVCCGAIQSPQILELSGIGDPDVLKKAGVDCIVPLSAVGNNFQDRAKSMPAYPSHISTDTFQTSCPSPCSSSRTASHRAT